MSARGGSKPTPVRSARRRLGQAAVESAIVLPLFVFIILGILQLTLAHQAKLMTKYAAYRAVRTGSILSVKHSAMERSAMAALLPMTVVGPATGVGRHYVAETGAHYAGAWRELWGWRQSIGGGAYHFRDPGRGGGRTSRILDVIVCNPYTGMVGASERFDDPTFEQIGGQAWGRWMKHQLVVQVSFYYRMPIPFVNRILWHLARGDEAAKLPVSMEVLRMEGRPHAVPPAAGATADASDNRDPLRLSHFQTLADRQRIFILPLRASYTMRMQSNYLGTGTGIGAPQDFLLPSPTAGNKCIRPGEG